MLGRWSELRRRQRVRLAAGAPTRLAHPPVEPRETPTEPTEPTEPAEPDLLHDLLPRGDAADDGTGSDAPAPARDAVREPAQPTPSRSTPPRSSGPAHRDFGPAGRPLNRQSPFYVGFVGAIGVLTAYGLMRLVSNLGTVFTLLTTAFFLALALDPLVAFLTRHRLRRGGAVATVFAGVVLVFTLLGFVVVPPVTTQATALVNAAPSLVEQALTLRWVQDLDQHYQVISRLQTEINTRLTDSAFLSQVAGGLLGAGQAIITGVFSTLTVLVLTLYFLSSLPALKQAAYAVVPASRRPRVISLSEEIMRRVGIYAVSQVAVAGFNAFCAWIMMSLVGIPYAAVLAVCVGFLGLVPMVGATLGALLVAVVAVFDSPTEAVIALVYFIVYQQLENYLLAPRIMRRTVSVPGAVTVVAALTGGTLLGMVGALIAIPAAAGLLLLYDEVLVPRQRRH